MKNWTLTNIILILLLCSSCEKFPGDDCFKSSGEITLEHRDVAEFESISLNDNINLIITQGNECAVTVQAGKNLLGSIITEVDDKELIVKNENTCNWMRNYNKDIDIYLTVKNLKDIVYRSSGLIFSTNAILGDSLNVAVWDGTGTIDMEVQTRVCVLSLHYGSVDFRVRGNTNISYIYAGSYGPFYCENLESVFTFMNNRGSNDCYVYCTKQLEVDIEYTGSIYYKGNPETIVANITGSGQLIKLDD
jgi:hypothetical protein